MFEREEMDEEAERPSTNPKRKTGQEMASSPALDRAVANFAACVRCSYFWGGYRVIAGEEAAETAVNVSSDGWLTLIWNQAMAELVHKSYGVLIDAGFYHYEGTCPECRRLYICLLDAETATEAVASAVPPETDNLETIETTTPEEPIEKPAPFYFRIQLSRQN